MKKGKMERLKEELDSMFNILYVAKENFEYCHYLFAPMTAEERKYLEIDRNLQFIRFSLWQITIIELDKLVSKKTNHKFNFFTLFNKLKPGGEYQSFQVNNLHLALWESSLIAHGATIIGIRKLRDKLYAHTDILTEEIKSISVTFLDIRSLINDLINILNNISHATTKAQYIFPQHYFHRDEFDLVRVLAEAHNTEIT